MEDRTCIYERKTEKQMCKASAKPFKANYRFLYRGHKATKD